MAASSAITHRDYEITVERWGFQPKLILTKGIMDGDEDLWEE